MPEIIGSSQAFRMTLEKCRKFARSDSPVLITGETGVGKNVVARYIHENSRQIGEAFVKVPVPNLSAHLLESDIFGHEKGSFTGAYRERKGYLERANGGTIFFDEIGDLPPDLQAKLLSSIEDKEFSRIGGTENFPVDTRIVLATNRNLEAMVRGGTFREDLYYRINSLRIDVPPLRKRHEDIVPLAEYFISSYCHDQNRPVPELAKTAKDYLSQLSWPGNIRQLKNFLETTLVMHDDAILVANQLRNQYQDIFRIMQPTKAARANVSVLRENEKRTILQALEASLWVQRDAASLLGITPRILNYRIRKYGISHPSWRKNIRMTDRVGRCEY